MGWMSQGNPGNIPPDGVSEVAGGLPKNRWLIGLILAFCCWHSAFLLFSIIPRPAESDNAAHPALDFYWLAFAGRQRWNLLDTIPTQHALDFRVVGVDENGTLTSLGPVLPDFTPYPKPERARYFAGLFRLVSVEPYRDAYLRRLGQQLPARVGPDDRRHWSFVVDAEYTRNLYHVRRDGHMSVHASKDFDLPSPRGDSQ